MNTGYCKVKILLSWIIVKIVEIVIEMLFLLLSDLCAIWPDFLQCHDTFLCPLPLAFMSLTLNSYPCPCFSSLGGLWVGGWLGVWSAVWVMCRAGRHPLLALLLLLGFVNVSVDCEVTHYSLLDIRDWVRKTTVLPILSGLLNLILLCTASSRLPLETRRAPHS